MVNETIKSGSVSKKTEKDDLKEIMPSLRNFVRTRGAEYLKDLMFHQLVLDSRLRMVKKQEKSQYSSQWIKNQGLRY